MLQKTLPPSPLFIAGFHASDLCAASENVARTKLHSSRVVPEQKSGLIDETLCPLHVAFRELVGPGSIILHQVDCVL